MLGDILVVDDEADIRTLVSGVLQDEGYQTRQAASVEEALKAVALRIPHLILLDVWLGTVDGLVLLEKLQKKYPDLAVIMMSGHGTFEMAVSAIKRGASDFIEKPFQVDRLLLSIARTLENQALRQENVHLRQKFFDEEILWGQAPIMQHLKASIDKIAVTNSRVLITGESGVGKELIAREIQKRSKKSKGPFVVVPCANLDPLTFEEELFGRNDSEGNKKVGLLEKAHGGVLFLDSVSDMPLLTQGKILRVLQENTFERLGDHASVPIDVRVLASTTLPLSEAIRLGHFREDLYYRLNVVPLEIPPLRRRREDIALLLEHFLNKMCASLGMGAKKWEEEALAVLQAYHWPGNIRELRNVTERALILSNDEKKLLGVESLTPEVQGVLPKRVHDQEKSQDILSLSIKQAREFFEKEYLLAQVSRFGGNISRTAEFIGMERSALHRKLRLLQVDPAHRKAG